MLGGRKMIELNENSLKQILKNLPTNEDLKNATFGQIYFTNSYAQQIQNENGKIMECVRNLIKEKYNTNEYDLESITIQILKRIVFAMVKTVFF